MAITTFRGIGPSAYIDQLHAIEAELGDVGGRAGCEPVRLDRGITRVVQLAEAVLEEREQLLRWGHAQAAGIFAKAGPAFLTQITDQATAYSEAYLAVDQRLASWRAWMHARLLADAAARQQRAS